MWLYNEVYSIRNGVTCHAIPDRIIYLYFWEVSPTIEWLWSDSQGHSIVGFLCQIFHSVNILIKQKRVIFHATSAILHPKFTRVKHDKNFSHLLDMLAEVPDPRKKKGSASLSFDALADVVGSCVDIYTDCQMGTPPPRPATGFGFHFWRSKRLVLHQRFM